MTTDRLNGIIAPANAAILCNMLDIYSLNTLVTFLIDKELAPTPLVPGDSEIIRKVD